MKQIWPSPSLHFKQDQLAATYVSWLRSLLNAKDLHKTHVAFHPYCRFCELSQLKQELPQLSH